MSDIAKCRGVGFIDDPSTRGLGSIDRRGVACPMRDTCARFTSPASGWRQSWINVPLRGNGTCGFHVLHKETDRG